jgi:hypothetical protein
MKGKVFGGLLVAMGCALGIQPAAAATVTFLGTGSAGGEPLGAGAVFTTGPGSSVTISNTLAANAIRSAGQAVSDLIFTLSTRPASYAGDWVMRLIRRRGEPAF